MERWTVGKWVQDDSSIVMRLLGINSTSLVASTADTVVVGRGDAEVSVGDGCNAHCGRARRSTMGV